MGQNPLHIYPPTSVRPKPCLLSFPKTPLAYKSKHSLSKLRLENTNKFLNKSGKILGNDEIKFFYTVDRNYLPSSLCLIKLLG